jgi:hypothetical protein
LSYIYNGKYHLDLVCLRKVVFLEIIFQTFFICLSLKKLINEKHFPVKEKFNLIFRKIFCFYFERKILCRSCKKFKNVMLFADYIKFAPQTFDCCIFCFEFFFQFHPLEFDFYINFDPHFYYCYLLFSYHFLNWNFLSIRFDPHFFYCYLFYLK